MYFIISGKVIVILPNKRILAILTKSDYFGEMGFYFDLILIKIIIINIRNNYRKSLNENS